MSTSTNLARSFVKYLIENGVSDFVLSPGSRNAPLSIALNQAAEKGQIDLHIKLDERGAAFFALGISKASEGYVALVCTSGTAVANYLPAALEALHGDNKLLFLTADRPARLRETGANQTTNQVNIFNGIKTFDLNVFKPIDLLNGPVHINLQFDEPLIGDSDTDWLNGIHPKLTPKTKESSAKKLKVSGNGLVVVGHDKGGFTPEEIENFSQGLVLISEDPLSFSGSIRGASIFLAEEKVKNYLKPDYVLIFGRTTLSRSINNFIALADEQYVIDKKIERIDPKRSATQSFIELPNLEIENIAESYRRNFEEASRLAQVETPWGEQRIAEIFACEIPDSSAVFIGSSRPIRDVEGFAAPRKGLRVFANRGLAGIDGNLSTIFGIAEKFKTTFALIGDITFLHDLSALISPPKNNCRIFVVQNNGGGIFSTLPQAGVDGFERIFGTPHNQNLTKIISGFGIESEVIKSESDLKRAISHNVKGLKIFVLEVPNREVMAKNLKEIYAKVSSAVRIGFNLA